MASCKLLFTYSLLFPLALTKPVHQLPAQDKRQFRGPFRFPFGPPQGVSIPAITITSVTDSTTTTTLRTTTTTTIDNQSSASSSIPTSTTPPSFNTTSILISPVVSTFTFKIGAGSTTRETSIVVTRSRTSTVILSLPPASSSSSIPLITGALSTNPTISSFPIIPSTSKYVIQSPTTSGCAGAPYYSSSSDVERPTTTTTGQSTCSSTPPPAATQTGIVAGCVKWYIAEPGDFCYSVAQDFGLDANTFMGWNPAVEPPTCQKMLAGSAYCVAICNGAQSTSPAAGMTTTLGTSTTSAFPASTTTTISALLTLSSFSSTLNYTRTSTLVPTSSFVTSTPSVATSISSFVPPTSSFATAISSFVTSTSASATPSSSISPNDRYTSYCGDGSTTGGWPDMSSWLDFDYLFEYNKPSMRISCEAWAVPNNSEEEMEEMRQSILSVGNSTAIDPRFILSIIMQESTGCVRVITTAYSHNNPGLMQSFNGTGSCNSNNAALGIPGVAGTGTVLDPCPAEEIRQQILDGTNGTQWGPGLKQNFATAGERSFEDVAQVYYRTARIYNGGDYVTGDLSQPCCTTSYASDIANRLMGWVHATREFTCS